MFDKFFTMKKSEKQTVLTVPYCEVMKITIQGTVDNKPLDDDEALYAIEVMHNNVRESATWTCVQAGRVFPLELKDGESLTIEAYVDDIDFHINGTLHKVN